MLGKEFIINECCFVYASERSSIRSQHSINLLSFLLHYWLPLLDYIFNSPTHPHWKDILQSSCCSSLLQLCTALPTWIFFKLTKYQTILRLTFLVSGAVICELLIALLVPPFWWATINLSISLIKEILRRWHQWPTDLQVSLPRN